MAGFAALAMLGACSTEDPDAPAVVDNGNDEGGYYIRVNIEDPTTRATGTEGEDAVIGEGYESAIYDIHLYITDASDNIVVDALYQKEDNSAMTSSDVAVFNISSVAYQTMVDAKKDQTDLFAWVYVNGAKNNNSNLKFSTADNKGLKYGQTNIPTWSQANGFLMSNSEKHKVSFKNDGTKEVEGKTVYVGTSKADAWDFTGTISVSRLAVRFDYVDSSPNKATTPNTYTLVSDNSVTMKVSKIAPATHADYTYRLPQYSATGATFGMEPFKDAEKRPFAVTEDTDLDDLLTMSYYTDGEDPKISPLVYDSKVITYGRPNSMIAKDDATNNISKQAHTWSTSPFAVVKAEITSCPRIAESKKTGKPIYVLNGVLLGGANELRTMAQNYSETNKFTITSKTYTQTDNPTEYTKLKNAVDLINGFLSTHKNTPSDDEFANQLKSVLGAMHLYEITADNENGSYHYYTYYSQYITHNADATTVAEQFNILRNTIYNLGVASFEFIGHKRDCEPGHEIKVGETADTYIKLTVEPKKWTLNTKNENWAL